VALPAVSGSQATLYTICFRQSLLSFPSVFGEDQKIVSGKTDLKEQMIVIGGAEFIGSNFVQHWISNEAAALLI